MFLAGVDLMWIAIPIGWLCTLGLACDDGQPVPCHVLHHAGDEYGPGASSTAGTLVEKESSLCSA